MKRYYVAVDPGLKTGVCIVDREGPTIVDSQELDFDEYVKWLDKTVQEYDRKDTAYIIERFIITPLTHKNGQAPWSLEGIGAMKAALVRQFNTYDFLVMNNTNAKTFSTNPKLKAVGLWHKGGKGHANDALRHALHYLVHVGWIDARLIQE